MGYTWYLKSEKKYEKRLCILNLCMNISLGIYLTVYLDLVFWILIEIEEKSWN